MFLSGLLTAFSCITTPETSRSSGARGECNAACESGDTAGLYRGSPTELRLRSCQVVASTKR